jgi:iron uptake system component EfeO
MKPRCHVAVALLMVFPGCASEAKSDADFQNDIVAGLHDLLLGSVREVHQAAVDLQAAAPQPVGRGWSATLDQDALSAMTTAWIRARRAWEPAEGVIAPLFPDIDGPLDSRYEDYLQSTGPDGDLFDGSGVTGMHAVERILFAPVTPAAVVAQESQWMGYKPAAWPQNEQEAAEFKNGLCQQLLRDSQSLVDKWEPQGIDLRFAFKGLTGLMNEQEEKLSLAANREEESRYAQRTLADLRDNLAGTKNIYALFVPWLDTKANGYAINMNVEVAFDRLEQTYKTVDGDAIPPPPGTWNSMEPSPDDQASPFGVLFLSVVQEVDATRPGSAVDSMNHAAQVLGLPQFTAQN